MKIASTIARYLLGLMFLIFGLNGFLHFIPMGPMPTGTAGQFMGAVTASNYMAPVFLVQLISAILLLANRYVPLALTLLAGIIFNILVFHVTMQPAGLPPGVLAAILWILVFIPVRSAFSGIFQR